MHPLEFYSCPFQPPTRKIGKHDGEEQNHGNQTIEQLILPRVATKQVMDQSSAAP